MENLKYKKIYIYTYKKINVHVFMNEIIFLSGTESDE